MEPYHKGGNKVYRQELKYKISPGSAQVLKDRLNSVCSTDENSTDGGYRVSSLYFDDYFDSAVKESLSGQINRKKFRIRIYNGSDTVIKLEKKSKHGNNCLKNFVLLTREQYDSILEGDYEFLRDSDSEVMRDFYSSITTRMLRPKVIVDYTREAFIHHLGNVRITFDKCVRSSGNKTDIFNEYTPYSRITGENETILEVKFTGFLPNHIKRLLQIGDTNRESFSKYTMCRLNAIAI
jgi:hypothetical protein